MKKKYQTKQEGYEQRARERKNKRYKASEINAHQFYKMPKFLFYGDCREGLSTEAKVLYALLRDRTDLSIANGWVNDDDEVYIIFRRKEMEYMLGCGETKLRNTIRDLKVFDLLDEEVQGFNQPNLLYLKYPDDSYLDILALQEQQAKELFDEELEKYHQRKNDNKKDNREAKRQDKKKAEEEKLKQLRLEKGLPTEFTASKVVDSEAVYNASVKSNTPGDAENNTPGAVKNNTPGVLNDKVPGVVTSEVPGVVTNEGSGVLDNAGLERSNPRPNNTNNNNTYSIHTQSINQDEQTDGLIDDLEKKEFTFDDYLEMVKGQIEYDKLMYDLDITGERTLNNIVNIIADVYSTEDGGYRINNNFKSVSIVKSQFVKLHSGHIEWVIKNLKENRARITNMNAYITSALWNALNQMDDYYQNEFNSTYGQ